LKAGEPNIPIAQTWPVRVLRPGERRSISRSATRALDVLEYFGEARRPLRAIDIARALGLHASTTDQLLKTMVGSAHLVFDARAKTYAPSHRLAGFTAWMAAAQGVPEGLHELLAAVQAATGEVVTLSAPNDLFMQVLEHAGIGPTGKAAERGLRISVFGSAIGAAYLSTLAEAEIRRLAVRGRLPLSEQTEVLRSVAQIRTSGFAEGPSGDGSIWSIATPLPRSNAAPVVLGMAGPAARVKAERTRLQACIQAAIATWVGR
jgi:DNA-binding IclR family transcriptional regulator